MDRSGAFALFFEVNNTAEKLGAPGFYTGMQALFPNASQKQPASRFASRSAVDSYLGPTVGAAKDAADVVGATLRGDLSKADINAIRRLTPGATLPIIRSMLEWAVVPELVEAVEN